MQIDLNHGSGCRYGQTSRSQYVADAVNEAVDEALVARNRAQPARHYVSTSGIGRTCLRQIQYDYLSVLKDEGRDLSAKTLRIFEAGHRLEDAVAGWLRDAGFDLRTHKHDGSQFGFAALNGRFRGHIDGCLVSGPVSLAYPALWENKALGASSWQDVVKQGLVVARPIYAAQIALYQAYLDLPNPALFTAINRDTWELHAELIPFDAALAQRMSDRAVDIVKACDAGELIARAATERSSTLCKGGWSSGAFHGECAWRDRCWGSSQ